MLALGESAPGIGVFEANTLYLGGDGGNDMALMFHKYELDGRAKDLGNGIYLGIITFTSHKYEFIVS